MQTWAFLMQILKSRPLGFSNLYKVGPYPLQME